MENQQVTFNEMPSILSQLLAKVERIERKLADAVPKQETQPEYVTITEAREILRNTVTVQTLYNWKYKGRIATTKVGRKLLFKRSDVEVMLKGNYSPTATEVDSATEAEANALLCDSVKRKRR
ncbi:MAG: helix-turn-helix domain-containing protein [Flavobacteriales bacterium]|nr:helix-turn-helix domain-containing protein [Flavobacteriales bacterium]